MDGQKNDGTKRKEGSVRIEESLLRLSSRIGSRLRIVPYFSPPYFCHSIPVRLGHIDQMKKDGKNMGAKR